MSTLMISFVVGMVFGVWVWHKGVLPVVNKIKRWWKNLAFKKHAKSVLPYIEDLLNEKTIDKKVRKK